MAKSKLPFYVNFAALFCEFFNITKGSKILYGTATDNKEMIVDSPNKYGIPMLKKSESSGLNTDPKLNFFRLGNRGFKQLKQDPGFLATLREKGQPGARNRSSEKDDDQEW